MSPPNGDRSVQLNKSQTLPCEAICGKSIQAHLHGGILCRHLFVGDFRKVLAENTRGIRSINVLIESASIWCTYVHIEGDWLGPVWVGHGWASGRAWMIWHCKIRGLQDFACSFRLLLGGQALGAAPLKISENEMVRNKHVSLMGNTAAAFFFGDFVRTHFRFWNISSPHLYKAPIISTGCSFFSLSYLKPSKAA